MNKVKIVCSNSLIKSFYSLLDKVSVLRKDFSSQSIIIVPDKFSMNAEKLLFERLKIESSFNVEVMSLTRLVKRLCDGKLGETEVLNSQSGQMLVTKILLDNYQKLGLIKNTLSSTLSEDFYNTILQLKTSGIMPNEVLTNSNNLNLCMKLEDIRFVYAEYERLSKNMLDSASLLDKFNEILSTNNYFKDKQVFVGMFESFSYVQMQSLCKIAKCSDNFTIGLSANSLQKNKHIYLNETLQSFMQALTQNGVDYEIENLRQTNNNINEFMSQNLFALGKIEPRVNDGNILLVEAENNKSEVDFVARKIKTLKNEKNVSFDKINIACTNFDLYRNIISQTFEEYDLPYFFDYQESLKEHIFGRFIIGLLNCFNSGFFEDYLFDVLKSPFLQKEVQKIEEFENLYKKYGIKNKMVLLNFEQVDFEDLRQTLLDELLKLYQKFTELITVKDYADFILEVLTVFDCKNILEKLGSETTGDISFRRATLQAYQKFVGAMDYLKYIYDEKVTSEYFLCLTENLLSSVNLSTVPLGVDKIYVGDCSRSSFYPNEYLFVLGAVDGELPKYKNDCGLITDSEINFLQSKNILNPSIRFVNKTEKYKLFELILSADKVCISYPSLSFMSPAKPSEIFDTLKKLFINRDGLNIEVLKVADEFDNAQLLEYSDSQYLHLFGSFEHTRKVVKTLKSSNKFIASAQRLTQSKYVKPNCQIEKTLARPLLFSTNKTSVSQLERYFNCPYRHFAQYGLRLKENEVYGIKKVDVGNFLHLVVEEFVELCQKNNFNLSKNQTLTLINNCLTTCFGKLDGKLDIEKFKAESLILEAQRLCEKIMAQISVSEFKPKFVEKYVESQNDKLGLKIIGKIDRVDMLENFFVIFDYKTGKSDFSFTSTYYGNKIQTIIYLSLLESMLNILPVGAFYIPIKNKFIDEQQNDKFCGIMSDSVDIMKKLDKNLQDEDIKQSQIFKIKFTNSGLSSECVKYALSPAEFLAVKNYCHKLVLQAEQEIIDGNIEPSPIKNACQSCPFAVMCEYDYARSGERQQDKKILKQDFEKILEDKND